MEVHQVRKSWKWWAFLIFGQWNLEVSSLECSRIIMRSFWVFQSSKFRVKMTPRPRYTPKPDFFPCPYRAPTEPTHATGWKSHVAPKSVPRNVRPEESPRRWVRVAPKNAKRLLCRRSYLCSLSHRRPEKWAGNMREKQNKNWSVVVVFISGTLLVALRPLFKTI